MIEVLLIVTFFGVFLSSRRASELGNPFQIYFSVWFFIIFLYWLSAETFSPISTKLGLLILSEKLIVLSLLVIIKFRSRSYFVSRPCIRISKFQDRSIIFWQTIAAVMLPFVFLRAGELANGESLFSAVGYINLRHALTEGGENYGFLGYFFTLSFVISSLTVFSHRQKLANLGRLIFSIIISLFYLYLSTGRTFILLFLCLMIIPLVVIGFVGLRGIFVALFFLLMLFVFVAFISARGISTDVSFLSNIDLLLTNVRGYTIAPLLAFSDLIASNPPLDWGVNVFRSFISIIHTFGLTDVEPVSLIKDYAFVPDPTNVYTVYEVYFRDFSYFGMIFPVVFLIMHYVLYKKAVRGGGVWIFFYAASVYPLLMQFFQDQYFSLLSTWLQIAFWYWLFLTFKRNNLSKSGNSP